MIGSNADEDTNGGYIADIALPTLYVGHYGDDTTIVLTCDGQTVDVLEFWSDAWQAIVASGAAVQLDPGLLDNDDPTAWCAATLPYGQGDFGTPNTMNSSCTP